MGAVSAKCGPLICRRGGTNSHHPRIAGGEQHGGLAVVTRGGNDEHVALERGVDRVFNHLRVCGASQAQVFHHAHTWIRCRKIRAGLYAAGDISIRSRP